MSAEEHAIDATRDYSQPLAENVSWEDYMQHYAETFHEWVAGKVFKLSPVHIKHDKLVRYLVMLLEAYLASRPLGEVVQEPFVMRLEVNRRVSAREPDIQVILGDNRKNLTATYMDGPADICIEVVSPESVDRDTIEKRDQYEKAGVPEYWLINPTDQTATFLLLDDNGGYQPQPLQNDQYMPPALPGFALHVPTLWQTPLPGFLAIGKAVETMLKDDEDEPNVH